MRTVNVVPVPGSEVASTVPPIVVVIRSTIDSPRPEPSGLTPRYFLAT